MTGFTWTNVALLAAAVYVFVMVARWHLDRRNTFDVRDYFLDTTTGKASLYNLITIVMAVLAVWVCVKWTLAGRDVVELVLGVLSIFVVGKEVRRGLDLYDRRNGYDDPRIERPPEGGGGDNDDVRDSRRPGGIHGARRGGELRAHEGQDGDRRG